ncbi:unnamed protein product, partial [Vitrella brassicaformis CCMP3155]
MDTDAPPAVDTNPEDVVMGGGGEGGVTATGTLEQHRMAVRLQQHRMAVCLAEERAARRAAALSSHIGAYINVNDLSHFTSLAELQQAHAAGKLTGACVVSKKASEALLERKKRKPHTFSGDQDGFPTFAFEVQSKCLQAKIGYLLDKGQREAGRATHGTRQYDADNAHLHAELVDALMGINDGKQPTNPRALAVVQQVPAGNGAAAWDALMEAFQPTHAGAWGDAFARVVNWQPDPKGTFEEAVTSFMHVVQRANELRQLQGVDPIADREMVEFFIPKLPASFGRVREAMVIDPTAKTNWLTLLKVCRQWADFTGSAAQQQGSKSGSSSAAAEAGGAVAAAQKVSFVPIPKKNNKGKKATTGQPKAQPTVQTGVSLKSKQTKASKDAPGNGGKAGKGKNGKRLKCWICDSTEHLCRNCPKRDSVKHLLAQQV